MRLTSSLSLISIAVFVGMGGCLGGSGSENGGSASGDGDGFTGGAGSGGGDGSGRASILNPRGPAPGSTSGSSGGVSTSGAPIDTGLQPDATLSSLDEAQALQACEAFADAARSALSDAQATRLACTVASLVELSDSIDADGSIDLTACNEAVDDCIADSSGASEMFTCEADTLDVPDCDATVAELEACIGDALALVQSLLGLLSCQTLANPTRVDPSLFQDAMDVPSCMAIEAQCPGVTLDVDMGSPGTEDPVTGTPPASGCDNTCDFSDDGECDDGGPDSDWSFCTLGTDCNDCGPR